MRRSTQISSSRVLIAATVLTLIGGALLCIPRTSSPPLTASITPGTEVVDTYNVGVPTPPSGYALNPLPAHDTSASEIEVPIEHNTPGQPIERVAVLQPIHTFSDQPAESTFDDTPAFGQTFEDEPFEDEPFEDFANASQTPEPQEPDTASAAFEDEMTPFDDTGFDDVSDGGFGETNFDDDGFEAFEHPVPAATTQNDLPEDEPVFAGIEPASPPVTDFEQDDAQFASPGFDETRLRDELQKMRSELVQSTDLRIEEAKRQHQRQVEQLQQEIDKLRAAQKTALAVKLKTESQPIDPLLAPSLPKLTVVPSSKHPVTRKQKQPQKRDIAIDQRGEVEPTMLPPTIPTPITRPKTIPKTVHIPQTRNRVPIEYPPIDMTPVTRQPTRRLVNTQPAYIFVTPAAAAQGQPQPQPRLAQPVRSTTVPQCTHSSPRRSLLSRLRSSRPEPCKHCGRIH